MIAANELDKTLEICEIKRNRKNIDLEVLEKKTAQMLTATHLFNGYECHLRALDLQDM